MPVPRLLAILRRMLKPEATPEPEQPAPPELPPGPEAGEHPPLADEGIKECTPPTPEAPLMVPDGEVMETLMQRARHAAIKEENPGEPLRLQFRRLVRDQIDAVYSDDTIEEKHLFIKTMVMEGLKELIDFHTYCAQFYAREHEPERAGSWWQDQGRLSVAQDLVKSIALCQADWMARDQP